MTRPLPFLLLAAAIPLTAYAQRPLPVIHSDTTIVSIRDGTNFRKDAWQLSPQTRPDVYEAELTAGQAQRVTFITDVDSISFDVESGHKYDFIIVHGTDTCLTQITGTKRVPMAVFDEAYQKAHRGEFRVSVPEVYELVNVAIALTPTAQQDNGLVYKSSPYYQAVRSSFDAYRTHPFVLALDSAMKEFLWSYLTLKMNGYAFEFDDKGTIVRSRIYDRTGFDGERTNSLAPYLELMRSFAEETHFRDFYRQHRGVYDAQVAFFRDTADLAGMKRWLDRQFPSSKPYDTYNVVFSPLVAYNQSGTSMRSNGFSEMQPHVNFPYAEDLSPAMQALSRAGRDLYRGATVFTELNHGYINPETGKYAQRVMAAISHRDHWVDPKNGPSYYPGIYLFDEYMNWALASLWYADEAPQGEQAMMIARIDRMMTGPRGFRQFEAFDAFLLDLYRHRAPGQTVADLYPRIIAWFAEHEGP